jgi:hypothetical protein
MSTYFRDDRPFLLAEQQVEMILDLTRRIHLLEGLMIAARQKRQSDTEEMPLAAVQINEMDELKFE